MNFTERGFGLRGALGASDRGRSAASKLKPGDVDWRELFGGDGVRWIHLGGIFAALGEGTADLTLEAAKTARKAGVKVSCDLNYRSSLWERDGFNKARIQAVLREVVANCDFLLGSQFDFENCLGRRFEEKAGQSDLTDEELFRRSAPTVSGRFPNLSGLCMTLRRVQSASVNDWAAMAYHGGEFVYSRSFSGLEILDRVGGGDGFASGLIYGLIEFGDIRTVLDYGVAHGALAMTTPGDTSFASLREVEALLADQRPQHAVG